MQRLLRVFIGSCILMGWVVLLSACGETASGVHMNDMNFVQQLVMLKKGQTLTLINDAAVVHIIENGRWDQNGNARSEIEAGAPTVDAQILGNGSLTIGPFTTDGTFHLYCTVHPNMNLTIIVQ